jgi:hypothetical protein
MSKQTKKPAEVTAKKVKNINLLPQVFATEPNKKMLDSTLDLMTSKGQLLNFKETIGLRSATNGINEFFTVEKDEVRRESQANNMLVMRDPSDAYLGKASYLDIENYFKVKGLELKDGIQLDKDINILDLPVVALRLSNYYSYYWVANDLPAIRIHLAEATTGGNKLSIANDIVGKPNITIIDDLTGKPLTLQSGMVIYFTGFVDTEYLTTNIDLPKPYFVYGVGEGIFLLETSNSNNIDDLNMIGNKDKKIPNSSLKKRPWDKVDPLIDTPSVKWDSEALDSTQIVTSDPEYITMEKYVTNQNHWQVIDHWYHISLIKSVADFLEVSVDNIVTEANKAKRPIITFNRNVKLYNWPTKIKASIATMLQGSIEDYTGKSNIEDLYGHTLLSGEKLVFEETPGIYTVSNANTNAIFTLTTSVVSGDGALIESLSNVRYYRVIFKNNKWQFAQNKTTKNQCPKFEFFTSNGTNLETFNEINYKGATILDFALGPVYDYILDRYVTVSNIDFDLIDKNNSLNVSPNQLKFTTDVDKTFSYNDNRSGDELFVIGPYGYRYSSTTPISFYQPRRGLDITRQTQDLFYDNNTDTQWSGEIIPTSNGFDTIHVFYDDKEKLKFYYNVEGHGLIRFSSKRGFHTLEQIIPLVSGGIFKIVCHDLPYALTFYKTEIVDNITRPVLLDEPYCFNNGTNNGVIELDLSSSININTGYIDNILNVDSTKLFWTANGITKTAIIRPVNSWRFLQFAYLRDKTNPIYHNYDYTISDITNIDGSLSYYQQLISTPVLNQKSLYGDKICLDTLVPNAVSKTAPLSLTTNPLNSKLDSINYYALYQHTINLRSNASNTKETLQNDVSLNNSTMGGGTLLKHNTPLAKTAVIATNLPYDFSEIIIKQGKHYDMFLSKLTYELDQVIKTNHTTVMSSLDVLNLAIKQIYLNQTNNENFWYHSNMIGWGNTINYFEVKITVDNTLTFSLSNGLNLIEHRAGKETILHIVADNKILMRDVDYTLTASSGYYTDVIFDSAYENIEVTLRQWTEDFNSKVPASLAKIGLSPVYKPEIYIDTSYNDAKYFLCRHDGTRYYLEQGVDENNYPNDMVAQLLFEYEKAVWSSISYDVEHNSNSTLLQDQPGYFRSGRYAWSEIRTVVNSEVLSWLVENNIFIMPNAGYDETDMFTHVYQIGSGDDANTMTGSWRAIYKYLYDTDRPHTHPWEMLGYTLKPQWWDTHYSWTDATKRIALEKALRTGNVSTPLKPNTNPFFARISNVNDPEDFPVDTDGNIIAPSELMWLGASIMGSQRDWVVGEQGPYETVFLNTQRGLAAETKLKFLASPAKYVNLNWVPGQVTTNEWGLKLDRTTNFWIQGSIEHNYHRQVVNDTISYTAGIESLYAEFCALNNKDFKSTVIDKFNNLVVNKEFLLNGFTNKNNIRVESTSIASQRKTLFVPEENYAVRLVKHYSDREIFYSALRIIWNGSAYAIRGFTNELGYFNYFAPDERSSMVAKTIGSIKVKEKNTYSSEISSVTYGQEFTSRQEIYDIIIGYGKFLESQGFKFEDVESYDLRNWQLSASQFIYWSNDTLAPGNYIDLNPAASGIILSTVYGQLENLEGTNDNAGQCVDRKNKPLFSKDLLVERGDKISIKSKNDNNPVYGIKLTFATYESVLHLDSTSVFNDIYFLPDQSTTKRSFVLGGKKSQDWTGKLFVPGYVISESSLLPNYDTFAEVGRNLLDIENVIVDSTILDASRAQFGLNRNPELRQLFLQDNTEVLFKNSITYMKGTNQVFAGLEPLTHTDSSSTLPLEEYMVRIGEFGNTKNIEFYEFELSSNDVSRNPQVIKFIDKNDDRTNPTITYLTNDSQKWVYKPDGKQLRFTPLNRTYTDLKTSGPVITGDTNYSISTLDDLPNLYSNFADLYNIKAYSETASYKTQSLVRFSGRLYYALTTVSPNTWINNSDKFTAIDEPFLPNVFVANYNKPNPDLSNAGTSIFTPGTWQVLQTVDRNVGVYEICTGLTDTSQARVSCNVEHRAEAGDYILIINASATNADVNGIWKIESVEDNFKFYINTRITETIKTGKVFLFKPVRFKNIIDLNLATGANADAYGYAWKKKYNPFSNVIGTTDTTLSITPSGYDPVYPIAITDDGLGNNLDEVSFDFGNYKVYKIIQSATVTKTVIKSDSLPLDHSDIEHLIIYDYETNKILAKLELFDPRKLYIPKVFKDDIDVISRVDPARYTRTTDNYKSVYASQGWFEEYVGRRWWDTSTTQFNDYESGDDITRARYWGTTVDGALPDIYEWTKSPVHPTQWSKLVDSGSKAFDQVASGQVYIDKISGSDNYHWVEEQDYVSGKTYTVYYFWVKNKETISTESKNVRVYATNQLSKILLNPSLAKLPWYAPITSNSIMLKGIDHLLTSNSTVVQIKKKTKGEEKHQQWLFVSEANTTETIPQWMHSRFRDSISGGIHYKKVAKYKNYSASEKYEQDNFVKFNGNFYVAKNKTTGTFNVNSWQLIIDAEELSETKFRFNFTKPVPNVINLHRYARLGNSIRPDPQSWFKDVYEARRTFVKKTNQLLLNIDISSLSNWGAILNQTAYDVFGDTIDLTKFWTFTDYQSADYDSTKAISATVLTLPEIYSVAVTSNSYIKVKNENTIYEKDNVGGYKLVYRTANASRNKGAIKLSDDLFDPKGTWGNGKWEQVTIPWDFDLCNVFYAIMEALRNNIFINEYETSYSKLTCAMFRYILSEQVNVDWLQKSSTIEPINLIGQSLSRTNTLQRDNVAVLTGFYSSVKSYRDKIRSSTVTKQLIENTSISIDETLHVNDTEIVIGFGGELAGDTIIF